MKKNCILAKRLCLATLLGSIFGLLCFFGFTKNPNIDESIQIYTIWSFSNPMMWDLIVNRTAIGFVVGLMGFLTVHPLFGFPLPSFFRGFMTGLFISLTLAIGSTMGGNSEPIKTFWIIAIAGGIIGMIIDIIVTKFIGQGSDLYEKK